MPNPRKTQSLRKQPTGPSPLDALKKATRGKPVEVLIDDINIDSRLQPRVEINFDKVEEYRVMFREGSQPPPVEIFRDRDGNLLMSDGFHRYHMLKSEGEETIQAYIYDGTWRDARLNAETRNLSHGQAFSTKDKFKIILDRIAYGYGGFVLDGDQVIEKPSTRDLAREFGVDQKTISNWLRRIADGNTEEISSVDADSIKTAASRGADGRVQDTTKIGKSRSKKKVSKQDKDSRPVPVQLNIFDLLKSIDQDLYQHEMEAGSQQMDSLNPEGKPMGEIDRAYMNGYVDALRLSRQIISARKKELKK